MSKIFSVFIVLGLFYGLNFKSVLADGIIIPDPPICDPCPIPLPMSQLSIRYHHVSVEIVDQVAVTQVDQIFYNPNDWEIEGDYVFPVPRGAVISAFALWIDGEPVEGEILDAETARQTYEHIVARMRDPALLEYADLDAFRARIYPIPPHGERRIEIEYSQVLTSENGLVHYLYPLGTEKFSHEPLESVSVTVEIESSRPIRAVYSPSHKISISRESENQISASYEESDFLPDQDFSLLYSIGDSEAFHFLTYEDRSDQNDPYGYFLLLLAPAFQTDEIPIPKDVLIVVDQSGSMEGEKFEQARDAMSYILEHLNPDDRFNIISFSTGVEVFREELSPASEIENAITWISKLEAAGSTDINRALLEAVSQSESSQATYLIFLTDGLPTVGEVESDKIISNLKDSAPDNLSVFVFGVGYDVDTYLLDSIAQNHHGRSTYVLPGEALDEIISSFYSKISAPVMTDLSLDFGGLITKDIYPDPLPDLFKGSQIAVLGRYQVGSIGQLSLNGMVRGRPESLVFDDPLFEQNNLSQNESLANIASLWATRKIGYLLQQIRLHGPEEEIIEEIVKLSIRYGIVTPYTSYLVTEPSMLSADEQERIISEEVQKFNNLATMPTFGQGAVEQAEGQNSLAQADAVPESPSEAIRNVRSVGSKTFVYRNGVWMDTRFDPNLDETTEIDFLSEQYFSLVRSQQQLAKAFALGPLVIVVEGNTIYEVVTDGAKNDFAPDLDGSDLQPIVPSEIPDPSDFESNQKEPDPATLIPCWGGLIISMVPMIFFGLSSIRGSKTQ